LPVVRPEIEHAWHLFVVQVDERERFMGHLAEQGVASGIHYPIPCHRQPVYALHPQHAEGTLPLTERVCERIVSIPIHPLHTEEETERVIAAVHSYR
ncbi:MAG TPA: DegT/DnrJ/EryC1/StrS family aminotransferase, partial [Candidatus Poseidoniales archaeon]|nr:DegT/DnrJ/EryC1/StrS family aminotransferase [Candidatus Poseidoniales archaeon]